MGEIVKILEPSDFTYYLGMSNVDVANPNTNVTITANEIVLADGVSASTVVVRLADFNGDTLTTGGETVVVISTGNAVVSTVIDNNDGTYTATVTNTTEESVTISATVNGNTIIDTAIIQFTNTGAIFNVRSDGASLINFDGNTLTFTSSLYDTVGSTTINAARITMPVSNSIGVNIVAVGILNDGNFAVLYLTPNGGFTGDIRRFYQDGSVNPTAITNVNNPGFVTVTKGTEYTIEKLATSFRITSGGGSFEFDFSEIFNLDTPIIGVLANNSNANYAFEIIS